MIIIVIIIVALISWAHGALQSEKGESEIICISQAWNNIYYITGLKIIKFTKTMTHSLKVA